jgi:hypothetical protein
MIIKYSADERIIERDLSKEKITGWEVTTQLGYKPKGSLVIDFDTSHIKNPTNQGGIYPPVKDILNYDEVLNYLKSNFGHLQDKAWKPVLRSQPRELE